MNLLNALSVAPAMGDTSPEKNVIVYVILGVAALAVIVLGLWGRKK